MSVPESGRKADEQPGNGNETTADRIGCQAEALERIRPEQRSSLWLPKDHEGELYPAIYTDPSAPNIPVYLPAIGQDEGIPSMWNNPQPLEQWRRNRRVRGSGIHQSIHHFVALARRVTNLNSYLESTHVFASSSDYVTSPHESTGHLFPLCEVAPRIPAS